MEVVAYSTAEEYNLEDLMDGLREQNLYHPSAMSEGRHHTTSQLVSDGRLHAPPPQFCHEALCLCQR